MLELPDDWRHDRYELRGQLRPSAVGFNFWTAFDHARGELVMVKATQPSRVAAALLDARGVRGWLYRRAGAERIRRWLVSAFDTEGLAVAELHHENILPLLDVGVVGAWQFHTYEIPAPQTLSDILDSQGSLDIETALDVGSQLVEATAHVHGRGRVHAFLHPANIVVGQAGQVRVTGYAFGWERNHVFVRAYAAPEHAKHNRRVPRTDFYMIGAVLWHALTGHCYRPATAEPERELRRFVPEAPAWLAHLLRRCLAADPSERPETIDEIRMAFEGRVPVRRLPAVWQHLDALPAHDWPEPIGTLLRDIGKMRSPAEACMRLIDLGESLIKLAVTVLNGRTGAGLREALGERPTLGTWAGLLRRVWKLERQTSEVLLPAKVLNDFQEGLVPFRNEYRGHGAHGEPQWFERGLAEHAAKIILALDRAPLFRRLRWDGQHLLLDETRVETQSVLFPDTCKYCGRSEVFIFNGRFPRFDTYLSYQTGHSARIPV